MNTEALTSALKRYVSVVEDLYEASHDEKDRAIYRLYLEQAEVLGERLRTLQVVDGDDVLAMERLFGNTWLTDDDEYDKAYSAWSWFTGLLRSSLGGMTMNERLYTLGLMDAFDIAKANSDRAQLSEILRKCLIRVEDIDSYLDDDLGG